MKTGDPQSVLLNLEKLKSLCTKLNLSISEMDTVLGMAMDQVDWMEEETRDSMTPEAKEKDKTESLMNKEYTVLVVSRQDLVDLLDIDKEVAAKVPDWAMDAIRGRVCDILMEKIFIQALGRTVKFVINDLKETKET